MTARWTVGLGATITLQLLLDPVHRRAIPVRPLPAVPELRQIFNGGFVAFQIEPIDDWL